ncbi:type I glutamate--ammonia ligase [candidate division KSB3 bacterium]|uniref:Glutamine synthetase n=1 Tax=candidate division KSB3 bacterium TaxID=2044937 RepID=A0A2G6E1J9_9BACT|nr:MAG: type I glutamate--ammonia ligase [candidate division KSB3 bacterium]PIE28580.1 MAG: type I glutamate--ammonia ligase [candidate division KSB3 bacterium]
MTDILEQEKKNILDRVEHDKVKFVQLQFIDILGVVKSLTIPVGQLRGSLEDGTWFDGSSIEGFTRIHESDMFLKPDVDTYAVIPWLTTAYGNTARFICDVCTHDGNPFEGDPRYILKKALAEAEKLGYVFKTGPELEFFLFKKENGRLEALPHDKAGYFDLTMDKAINIRSEMHEALSQFGIYVEALHHEVADGQHEIDFRYDYALKTADHSVTLRFVLKAIAQKHGLHATFIPKPIAGVSGSGMHTHMSLFDQDDNNIFFDEHAEYMLSDTATYFIGGILQHMLGICAVTNPTVNSYKRLVPGYEAPVYLSWARHNRSALVRIPRYSKGKSKATRCELRCPDPTCNPYLAFALMLKAGLNGITAKTIPPAPVEEDLFEYSTADLKKKNIATLPASLGEAIAAMKDSTLVKETLGEHTYTKFIEAKQIEWDQYCLNVSQWELDRYLEVY